MSMPGHLDWTREEIILAMDFYVQAGGLDGAVWRDYFDDLPRLHSEAEAIRARVDDGAIMPASTVTVTEDVDIEQQHTETYMYIPSGQPRAAERAEQRLVLRYRDYMAAK